MEMPDKKKKKMLYHGYSETVLMICIPCGYEHTNTSGVAAFTLTDSMEKEKKIFTCIYLQNKRNT